MSTEEKIRALANAVSYLLDVAMITAPVHYRTHTEYLQEVIDEILEDS